MRCFRVVHVTASRPISIFEAARWWTREQRRVYRAMFRDIVNKIGDALSTNTPVKESYIGVCGDARMAARLFFVKDEICVVITYVNFDMGGDDPDGGAGLSALAYEKIITLKSLNIYICDKSWFYGYVDKKSLLSAETTAFDAVKKWILGGTDIYRHAIYINALFELENSGNSSLVLPVVLHDGQAQSMSIRPNIHAPPGERIPLFSGTINYSVPTASCFVEDGGYFLRRTTSRGNRTTLECADFTYC